MTIFRLAVVGALLTVAGPVFATDFLTGERVNGLQKICFYHGPGGASALTVASYALCPLSNADPLTPRAPDVPMPPAPSSGINPLIPLMVQPPVFMNPFDQLAKMRAQQEASSLNQQQIALNARALEAVPNNATSTRGTLIDQQAQLIDEMLVSLENFSKTIARQHEIVKEKQAVIDAAADVVATQEREITELKKQLAEAVHAR
jgi:hypothetical protein